MKSGLLFTFLLITSISYCQFTFEEINIPADFNIAALRQSPGGEYFIQAANDEESIYTSLNGTDWTRTSLPVKHRLGDIQFFSDGTPVLQGVIKEHLIRRNGTWYTMQVPDGWRRVEVSFIKEDTLFAFQDQIFAYSLDKGQSFTKVFTYEENISAQTAYLWKSANHFILHHTTGSSNLVSIFNKSGERILYEILSLLSATTVYNNCGQLLIYALPQPNTYYLLSEPELQLQQGITTDIIPSWSASTEIFSQGGRYFVRDKNKIYRSSGCNFDWEELEIHDLIENNEYAWIGPHEDIFLYNWGSNHFIKNVIGSVNWVSHYPDINYPLVYEAGESSNDNQFILTSNFLFHKNSDSHTWEETDSIGGLNYQVQYAPNGDLYINKLSHLEYSIDNGAAFSIIELPPDGGPLEYNFMQVLANDIIFISNRLSNDCFYTLNNGQDWILAGVSYPLSTPLVKLVDNYILAVELNLYYTASKINIVTNEVATEDMGDNFDLGLGAIIADDGTLYFQTLNLSSGDESLFRYRFGEGLKFLGHFNELINARYLAVIGSDLYGFSTGSYHLFDGETLKEYSYFGLPGPHFDLSFTLSDNGHVYAILDHSRIFRSVEPTVNTKETGLHMEVKIYPNPANTFISVSISENKQKEFDSYAIYDIHGRLRDQSNTFSGKYIDVSHLAAGSYTLLLRKVENVTGIGKFMIQ